MKRKVEIKINGLFFFSSLKNENKYLAVPSINNPRFIIPLKNKKLFQSGLEIHNTAALKNRLIKKILYLSFPLPKLINFQVIYSSNDLNDFLSYVKNKLNIEKLSNAAFYIGTDKNKNRKLTMLLMEENGAKIGILKYPLMKESSYFINNEYEIINKLRNFNFSQIKIPYNIKKLRWNGTEILYEENIFNYCKQISISLDDNIINATIELAQLTMHQNNYGYFNNFIINIKKYLLNHLAINEIFEIIDYIKYKNIPIIQIHGDFVPYNVKIKDNKLFIVDWEFSRLGLPLFDLFHFVFQGKYQIEKMSVEKCLKYVFYKNNLEKYRYYFGKLDFDINSYEENKIIRYLFILYLIDNLLFEDKIKVNPSLIESHYFLALNYILCNYNYL